jgi:hypothetical protein
VKGSCGHGNEPSGSIKCWEVLKWLHSWRLLKKCSASFVSGCVLFLRRLSIPVCGQFFNNSVSNIFVPANAASDQSRHKDV